MSFSGSKEFWEIEIKLFHRSNPSINFFKELRAFEENPPSVHKMREASSIDTPWFRAVALINSNAFSPIPRLGVLTIRSKARLSSGLTATLK